MMTEYQIVELIAMIRRLVHKFKIFVSVSVRTLLANKSKEKSMLQIGFLFLK